MSEGEHRKVGKRGQVTIPKELRERFGIEGGDDVLIHEEAGKLVIEQPLTREELAEGYRKRSQRIRELADELADVSTEANEQLGDAPEW
ncbi:MULTISPECIES: AbrB/MazE/SpoVT family DNA-binding domain-containing protein [Halomicrobium]|uniref:Transcriptional regulator, AbrB family n=2 Tax=Halomicrobium mukohataei TaxID=57705 RepID=C7NZQ4_HALMD|nr:MULTISPECIES: AbrB/MazE/SpoVT family DNA-binding domain-containing protein [Halomicrobium]ACV48822.1 transcriptional regulator, AbrB family [Halomicrobium mukohataei DSM 12286]QCD64254.1 AbrB/MazE/SpoVT family DNA-binding domain-containing protein [Halomicrobium mukohataei]QFR19060.1 AbrB/MazE/SpoVT family DNA-binding domain-containing protein [Halomicrobium sp. ZPS1]